MPILVAARGRYNAATPLLQFGSGKQIKVFTVCLLCVCVRKRFLNALFSSFLSSCQNLPPRTRVRPEADNKEFERVKKWLDVKTPSDAPPCCKFCHLCQLCQPTDSFYIALKCSLMPNQLRQRRRHLLLLEVSKHLLQTGTSKHSHLKDATWWQHALD